MNYAHFASDSWQDDWCHNLLMFCSGIFVVYHPSASTVSSIRVACILPIDLIIGDFTFIWHRAVITEGEMVLIVSATVTNLQQKMEGLQTANTLMKEDIRIAKSNILQLQQENLNLRRDKESLLDEHHRQMQVTCRARLASLVTVFFIFIIFNAIGCTYPKS